jgi:hypothetical protein
VSESNARLGDGGGALQRHQSAVGGSLSEVGDRARARIAVVDISTNISGDASTAGFAPCEPLH